jgi:putative inorganic carbon (HCO3(-)) transporter
MQSAENSIQGHDRVSGLAIVCLIASVSVIAVSLVFLDSVFLVAALCIGLATLAVFRFELFLYAQIFLLPWYPLLNANLPLRDVFLVLHFILLAGVWIARAKSGKPLSQWFVAGSMRKIILAFAAMAAMTLLVSSLGPNIEALRSLARLFSYLALFFAVLGWVETREQIENVIRLILFSTILVALFGFYQVWQRGYTDLYYYLYPLQEESLEEWNGRITSFLFHFNSLAGYLNLVLPLSLACMVLAKSRRLEITAIACHTLALAALYFTGSRGGLIAYAGMILVSLFFLKPRKPAFSRVLLTAVMATAIVVSLQPRVTDESRLTAVDDYTAVTRLALWSAAGSMFVEHPILGVGYGNYRSLYDNYIPAATPNQLDAHNLYLQFLSETGVIGSLIFTVMIVGFVRIAVKLARNSDPLHRLVGIAMAGALLTTLIHGMVDYLFNVSPQFGGLFWLVMGLGVVAGTVSCNVDSA